MVNRVKVIQYGLGAMGSNMVRLLQSKPFAQLTGVIDKDKGKIGRDAGEVVGLGHELGIPVQFPPDKVLSSVHADVVLHATTAFMQDAYPQIQRVLERKINVVTIAQELFFPLGENVKKAKELDQKAKEMGVRVTAAGINPGFIMDIVPIVCSLPCWEIDRVLVRRIVDFSPYGPDEMKHIGAGMSPAEFNQGVKDGIIGHIGLLETSAMVAHCLSLRIDRFQQTKEPILTKKRRDSEFAVVEPGKVCGFRQNVIGFQGNAEVLSFMMIGLICPDVEQDGVELGDYTRICGKPNVDITIKEEISQKGGLGTAAVAVNMIPRIMQAQPGFHTMNTLPLPHIWNSEVPQKPFQEAGMAE
jgi:hypothetical protein